MAMRRSAGDGWIGVVEGVAIGDESAKAWCQYAGDEYKLAIVEVE